MTARVDPERAIFPAEMPFRIGEHEITIRMFSARKAKRLLALLVKSLKAVAQQAPGADMATLPGGLEALQAALTESYDELLMLVVTPDYPEITVEYADEHMTSLDVLRFVKAVLQVNQLPLLRQEMLEIRGLALALVQDGRQLGLVETGGSESTTS